MSLFVQQGWQCPCCQRVYGPTMPMCFYCGNPTKVTASTNTAPQHTEMFDHKCQLKLAAEGKPYPRTCHVCGFGPCKMGRTAEQEELK